MGLTLLYDELQNKKAWFSPLLNLSSWFDSELVSSSVINLASRNDATLETNAGHWVNESGNNSVVQSTGVVTAREGSAVLLVTPTGGGTSIVRVSQGTAAYVCSPNTTYTVLYSLQNNDSTIHAASGGGLVQVPFWDSSGGGLGNANDGYATSYGAPGTWSDNAFTFTTPSTAAYMGFVLTHTGTLPAGHSWSLDRFGMFLGTVGAADWVAPPPLTPEAYGAVGDGVTDDTTAVQAALNACGAGDTLTCNGTYKYSNILTVSNDGAHITGTGTFYASDETNSSFLIDANNVTVDGGLQFTMMTPTMRYSTYNQMRIRLTAKTGITLQNISIVGAAAAGIYIGGADNFTLDTVTVSDTEADGIHMTEVANNGTVLNCIVNNSGDDGFSVVSYVGNGSVCHDIAITNATVNTSGARGVSVVGGSYITYTNSVVDSSAAAAVYVAAEPGGSATFGNDHVTFDGTTITNSNTNAAIDHGAIVIYNGQTAYVNTLIDIKNFAVSGTRTGATADIRIIADTTSCIMSSLTMTNIAITGGPTSGFSQTNSTGWYVFTNVTKNGSGIGGTAWTQTPSDNSAPTDRLLVTVINVKVDISGPTDSIIIERVLVFQDTAGVVDTRSEAYLPVFQDTTGAVDSITTVRAIASSQQDLAGLSDYLAMLYGPVAQDTASPTDSISTVGTFLPSFSDVASPTDSPAFSVSLVVSDSAGVVDSTSQVKVIDTTVSDSAVLTDSATTALSVNTSQSDGAGSTDSTILSQSPVQSDSAGETDNYAVVQAKVSQDSATTTDSISVAITWGVVSQDSSGTTDSSFITRSLVIQEATGLVDTSNADNQEFRIDLSNPTDSIATTGVFVRTSQDIAGTTDSASIDQVRVSQDIVGVTDSISILATFNVTAQDAAVPADSIITQAGKDQSIQEVVGTSDSIIKDISTVVSDTAGLVDTQTVAGSFSYTIFVSDSAISTDSQIWTRAVTLQDLSAPTDSIFYDRAFTTSDPAGESDSTTILYQKSQSAQDNITTIDTFSVFLVKDFSDSSAPTDSPRFTTSAVISDDSGTSDSTLLASTYVFSVSDEAGVTDSFTAGRDLSLVASDVVSLIDTFVAGHSTIIEAEKSFPDLESGLGIQLIHAKGPAGILPDGDSETVIELNKVRVEAPGAIISVSHENGVSFQ